MIEPSGFLIAATLVLVIAVSVLATRFLVKFSFLDSPNSRSAHQQAVPTAGGFGVILGIGAGCLVLVFSIGFASASVPTLFGLSCLATILGFVDDTHEISAKLKFALIALLAIAMALLFGPVRAIPFDGFDVQLPWVIGMAGTVLWGFTVINSVNFLDGTDGAIPLSALVVSVVLAVLGAMFGVWSIVWSSLLLAAALAGFLPFNLPKAQIFLGDTGSLFIGTWLAGSGLILIAEGGPTLLWLLPLVLMPWLSDVLLTMAWRLQKRYDLLSAHNDHLYQWMVRGGKTHLQVALMLSLQIAAAGSLAILFRHSATSAFLAFAAAASFAVLVHWRVRLQVDAQRSR